MECSSYNNLDQVFDLDSISYYQSCSLSSSPPPPASALYHSTPQPSPLYPLQFQQQHHPGCQFAQEPYSLASGPMILTAEMWDQPVNNKPAPVTAFDGSRPDHLDFDLYQPSSHFSPYLDQNIPASCHSSPYSEHKSPVTPSGSPSAYPHPFSVPVPSLFVADNGQYQYTSAYNMFMPPLYTSDSFFGLLAPQDHNLDETPFPSPATVPSLAASSPHLQPTTQDEDQENDQDDDESEDEQDKTVLPNSGNTELRGMGLYDDRPTLYPTSPASSPVTRHDVLKGKGLVLERSFGLPETTDQAGDMTENDDTDRWSDFMY